MPFPPSAEGAFSSFWKMFRINTNDAWNAAAQNEKNKTKTEFSCDDHSSEAAFTGDGHARTHMSIGPIK